MGSKQPEFHTVETVDLPRVGTVLNLVFGYPPKNKIVQDAMKLGSQVDKMLTERLRDETAVFPRFSMPGFHNAWKAAKRYIEEQQPQFTELQPFLSNVVLGYCGTPDAIDYRNRIVIDFKVATAIRERYWWQTNAYIPLIESDKARWEDWKRQVVRFDARIGEYELITKPFDTKLFWIFDKAVNLWYYMHTGGYDVKELRGNK